MDDRDDYRWYEDEEYLPCISSKIIHASTKQYMGWSQSRYPLAVYGITIPSSSIGREL